MKTVFTASHYYLALLNRNDPAHERAARLATTLTCRVLTTARVVTELAIINFQQAGSNALLA